MLSVDFSYFLAKCIHENLYCFSFVFAEWHESDIKALASGFTLGWTPTRKRQITCKRKPCVSWWIRVAIPFQPQIGLWGQGHGVASVCQMWSTKNLSLNPPKDIGNEGSFIPMRRMDLFPLDLKTNNILAEQMELTFFIKNLYLLPASARGFSSWKNSLTSNQWLKSFQQHLSSYFLPLKCGELVTFILSKESKKRSDSNPVCSLHRWGEAESGQCWVCSVPV